MLLDLHLFLFCLLLRNRIANTVYSLSVSKVIDSQIGDSRLLDCPINRNQWSLPSILQWYRSINNYSIPVASQFNDYPVHIDDLYVNNYNLLANGSLRLENIQLSDNDTFECRLILIDRGLLDVKEKYLITLRVNEKPYFTKRSNPLIIALPYSTVNFICETYGVPHPTVTWYKVIQRTEQQVTDEENLQLVLVNDQQFTLHNVDDSMAGKYRCMGTNQLGTIQSEFQLLIRGSIYWKKSPENQTVKINSSITLRCEGQSSEPLQYQWLKDEGPLSDAISSQDRIRTFSDGILNINRIEPVDHGWYICKISTPNSTTIRSKPAHITVKYPPIPSRTRQSNNLTLIKGSLGVCPCLLDAYPPIQSVAWYRNRRSIRIEPKGGAFTIDSEYGLVIRSVEKNDQGEYFCRAQNSEGFGQDSIPFHVVVKDPIYFITKPDPVYYVQEKDRLALPCIAVGNPQPKIKWLKNSLLLNDVHQNLTLESIEKSDHGIYICQASNEHITVNISTSIVVENTTPQAPQNVAYEQVTTNVLLTWEPGYDGGKTQHFIIWYRMIKTRKGHWNQIRVLPDNATEFLLFDLQLQQTYEVTIVGENDIGLGAFSPIISIYLNNNQDLSVGYFLYSNETDLSRPLPPVDVHLSYSGSGLYIKWNHPSQIGSSVKIVYYVIQWSSSVVFNNQRSHQSTVVPYPGRSYILRDVNQAKYTVQIVSYSDQGIYSKLVETEINIQFNSILAYHGSRSLLVSIFCFLTVLTFSTLCICVFFLVKYYYYRPSYSTDIDADLKLASWCCPSIKSSSSDNSSSIETDRYQTNLLTPNDFHTSRNQSSRVMTNTELTTSLCQLASSPDCFNDSVVSEAKITTIPRSRKSILSNTVETPQLTHKFLSAENPNAVVSSALTFVVVPIANDDTKMTSFFQPISSGDTSPVSCNDTECRKNSSRLPLEAVPELSELTLDNNRYSLTQSISSTTHISHNSHSVQPSPVLITFDSSSLKRRS